MGSCSHALPENPPAILQVNPGSSTAHVANLNAWPAADPPFFIKDTNLDSRFMRLRARGVRR